MRRLFALLIVAVSILPFAASADDLTRIIQMDLVTLGYEPGNTDGEATTQTIVAISKFQAENGLEVTGAATPQLAGVIKAAISRQTAPAAAAAPVRDEAALRAAQQACLQQRAEEAQESAQRRRGLGRLAQAVGRAASRVGGGGISSDISQLSSDVYTAGAVASDLKGAAEDLGLTESDIEACRNPS